VAVAAAQLWLQKKQQITAFEDRLTEQYRAIVAELPLEALLEDRVPDDQRKRDEALHTFFRYFDLTNEQIFLWEHCRISRSTWKNWKDGIRDNLNRQAFRDAWSEIAASCPKSFNDLRAIVPPEPWKDSRSNARRI
jgi:hypothetical protein